MADWFLDPGQVAWGLVVPVIVLLHLLKLRRQPVIVSSTLLWERLARDPQANAPFQKLRRSLLLLLQVAAAACLAAALMRPFSRGPVERSRRLILVVDVSASMQATDAAPSRLGEALARAHRIVQTAPAESEIMVITAGRTTSVVSGFTRDRALLSSRLATIRAEDTPADVVRALTLAGSIARGEGGPGPRGGASPTQVQLLTDGGVVALPPIQGLGENLTVVRFGRGGQNVGLVRLDVRRNPERATDLEIFTEVASFSGQPRQVTVDLEIGGRLVDSQWVELGGRARRPLVFHESWAGEARITVRLAQPDELAIDDRVVACVPPARAHRVAVVGDVDPAIQRILSLLGRYEVVTTTPAAYRPEVRADLVVFGRFVPAVLPGVPVWLVAPERSTPLFDVGARAEGPRVVDWDRDHPVNRFASFSGVSIDAASRLTARAGLGAVVDGDAGPLVLAGEAGGRRVVVFGFDPSESDLTSSRSFPIVVANAVGWLVVPDTSATLHRTGRPLVERLRPGLGRARVKLPSGETRDASVAEDGALTFVDTDRAGFYEVLAGNETRTHAFNLVDAAESDISPAAPSGAGQPAGVSGPAQETDREHRWWAILAALAFLLVEWVVYHRRVSG